MYLERFINNKAAKLLGYVGTSIQGRRLRLSPQLHRQRLQPRRPQDRQSSRRADFSGDQSRESLDHPDRRRLPGGLPLHALLRVEDAVDAARGQVLDARHLEEEVHDAAGDLVEAADDQELLGVHLLHDARVAGQRHHLLLDVADDGLAVVRARVLDALQAVEVQATLERHQAVAELLGLSAQGVLGQARGLDGAAALVAHDHEHLHLQVVHGVLQRAHGGVGHGVAGAADHEHVAQVLVEDDLGRHAGVSAAQDRGGRELLVDQRAALEGALLGPRGGAGPEAHVAALEGLEDLLRGEREGGLLALVGLVAGLGHRPARPAEAVAALHGRLVDRDDLRARGGHGRPLLHGLVHREGHAEGEAAREGAARDEEILLVHHGCGACGFLSGSCSAGCAQSFCAKP
mmetsp:Transcript_52041/g.113707  ORF Transcript_52041/g.113707 Transcript_52041/m.113707 type:complete len:403 (+) Transcript_52041:299-1507(+)